MEGDACVTQAARGDAPVHHGLTDDCRGELLAQSGAHLPAIVPIDDAVRVEDDSSTHQGGDPRWCHTLAVGGDVEPDDPEQAVLLLLIHLEVRVLVAIVDREDHVAMPVAKRVVRRDGKGRGPEALGVHLVEHVQQPVRKLVHGELERTPGQIHTEQVAGGNGGLVSGDLVPLGVELPVVPKVSDLLDLQHELLRLRRVWEAPLITVRADHCEDPGASPVVE